MQVTLETLSNSLSSRTCSDLKRDPPTGQLCQISTSYPRMIAMNDWARIKWWHFVQHKWSRGSLGAIFELRTTDRSTTVELTVPINEIARQILDYFVVAYALLNYSKSYKYGTRIYYPQVFFLHDFSGPSSKYSFANERTKISRWFGDADGCDIYSVRYHFFRDFRNVSLK